MEDERMRLRDEREDEEGMRAGERERSPKAKQTKSKKKNPDGLAPPAWLVFHQRSVHRNAFRTGSQMSVFR